MARSYAEIMGQTPGEELEEKPTINSSLVDEVATSTSEGLGTFTSDEFDTLIKSQTDQLFQTAAAHRVSLDEAATIIQSSEIGFKDTIKDEWTGLQLAKKIPFIGAGIGAGEMLEIRGAIKRLKDGEIGYQLLNQPSKRRRAMMLDPKFHFDGPAPDVFVTADDQKMIDDYLVKISRTYNLGGKIAKFGSALPTWMLEFIMTSGVATAGKIATKKAAQKIFKEHLKSKVGRTALKAAGWAGGGIARATALPTHVAEGTLQRQLMADLDLAEPERLLTSFAKSYGSVIIEAMSEEAGAAITKGLAFPFKGLGKFAPKFMGKLQQAWIRKTGGTAAQFTKKIFKKGGYSNIVGELGEERLATLMTAIFDIDDFGAGKKANLPERILAAVEHDFNYLDEGTRENAIAEFIILLAPTVAKVGIGIIAPGEKKADVAPSKIVAPTEAKMETIVGVASRYKGEIFEGTTHLETWKAAAKSVGKENLSFSRFVNGTDYRDGFITSTGRFVTREEATQIAKKAKQQIAEDEISHTDITQLPTGEETIEEKVAIAQEEKAAEDLAPGKPLSWDEARKTLLQRTPDAEPTSRMIQVEMLKAAFNDIKVTKEVISEKKKDDLSIEEDITEANKVLIKEMRKMEKLRISERVPAVEKLRKEQAVKAAELYKKFIAAGDSTQVALRKSKAGLKGEADVPHYIPPVMSNDLWEAYSRKIVTVYPAVAHEFERLRSQDALDKLRNGKMLTDSDIALLRNVFGQEVMDELADIMKKLRKGVAQKAQRKWDILSDIIQFLKTPANFDIQFTRQAMSFAMAHPIVYAKGELTNIRAYLSSDWARKKLVAIKKDPHYKMAKAHGVNFREAGGTEKQLRLEQFAGDMPTKLARWGRYRGPVLFTLSKPVRGFGKWLLASERAGVAAINQGLLDLWKKRASRWEKMIDQAALSETSPDLRRKLLTRAERNQLNYAAVINAAMKVITAKSTTGKSIQTALNHLMWSPSFTWSRFLQPLHTISKPGARIEAARIAAGNIGQMFLVGSVVALASALYRDEDDQIEVELNPQSSKFGKYRYRKDSETWFDFTGGEAHHLRFLVQFVTGAVKKQSGRMVKVPRYRLAVSLAKTKQTALISVVTELVTGYDFFGNPLWELPDVELLRKENTMAADAYADLIEALPGPVAEKTLLTSQYIQQHILPFFVTSFAEAAIMDGWPQAVAAGVTESFALSAQSYRQRAKAELEIMQDELAVTRFGKDWLDLSLSQKTQITNDVPGLAEKLVMIFEEKVGKKPIKEAFPTAKQIEVQKSLQAAMPESLQKEMKKVGLSTGGIGNRLGGHYLNEQEFKAYQQFTIENLLGRLNSLFVSPVYKNENRMAEKRKIVQKEISAAKREAAQKVKETF